MFQVKCPRNYSQQSKAVHDSQLGHKPATQSRRKNLYSPLDFKGSNFKVLVKNREKICDFAGARTPCVFTSPQLQYELERPNFAGLQPIVRSTVHRKLFAYMFGVQATAKMGQNAEIPKKVTFSECHCNVQGHLATNFCTIL